MANHPTPSPVIAASSFQNGTLSVTVRGEIDLHNSPELRSGLLDALSRDKTTKIVLNLAQVPYMDSSAVAVLVEMLRKMRAVQGKICLTHLHPRVKSLLEIARLSTVFVLCGDDAEAAEK